MEIIVPQRITGGTGVALYNACEAYRDSFRNVIMSAKWLVAVLGVTAAVVYSVDAPKPDPATADPQHMSAAVVPHGVGARLSYGFGAIGSHMVAGMVLGSATEVENDLQNLRKALKAKRGQDGTQARDAAKIAAESSRLAIQSIYTADPVIAVRNAMRAKNYVNVAKKNLATPN
jgi:hypothetical protein